MGKRRLEKVKENEGESTGRKWFSPREKLRQFKLAFGDWGDDQKEKIAMQARMKFVNRWMEESGAERMEDIDYKNPQISLEWKLCDPAVLRDLQSEGGRERFFQILTDEEKDVYLNKTDENGCHYYDLEGKKGFTKKNITKSVIKFKRG